MTPYEAALEAGILRPDGSVRVPELQIRMRCDGAAGCKGLVEYAPRVWVPSCTPQEAGHEFLRMMTSLHCCRAHLGFIDRESFLDDKIKALFEDAARKKRPLDFKCEFDNAFIEYIDVRSDDYMAFIRSAKGVTTIRAAATVRPGQLYRHG